MRTHSSAASCCLALVLIALCTLLSGCASSLSNADYDQVAKDCNDHFLNSTSDGQHVFVDPQLANHEYAPLTLRGVEQKLTQLEDKAAGKIRFRVIAQQLNNRLGAYSETPAQLLKQLILEKAKNVDSFPNDNYVFILLVRYKGDVQSTSIDATCSPELLTAYPTLETLLDSSVSQAATKFLPNPADEAVLLVAREVTAEVAKAENAKSEEAETLRKAEEEKQRLAETEKKAEEERQQRETDTTGPIVIGIVVGAVISLLGVVIFRRARRGY